MNEGGGGCNGDLKALRNLSRTVKTEVHAYGVAGNRQLIKSIMTKLFGCYFMLQLNRRADLDGT